MISTCCSSDYHDVEYELDENGTKFIPSYSFVQFQQSIRLIKFVKENRLSNEIFIHANAILHKLVYLIPVHEIDQSILVACLSLATKLNEHSAHSSLALFNSDLLMSREDMICNALDWDIDVVTPIHYVEVILSSNVLNCLMRDRLRLLTHELIVLCLTDIHCMGLSAVSIGIGCFLVATEMINYRVLFSKEVLVNFERHETSLIIIRQIIMNLMYQQ